MCLKRHREASANKAARATACQGALGLALRKAKQTAFAAARKSSKNPLPASAGPVATTQERRLTVFSAPGEHTKRRVELEANLGRWGYTKQDPNNGVSLAVCPESLFLPTFLVSAERTLLAPRRDPADAGTLRDPSPPRHRAPQTHSSSPLKGSFLRERVPGSTAGSSPHFFLPPSRPRSDHLHGPGFPGGFCVSSLSDDFESEAGVYVTLAYVVFSFCCVLFVCFFLM